MATYLASLETDDELATAGRLLLGTTLPRARSAHDRASVGPQIAAIAERIAGQGEGALFAAYNESSDIGTAVRDLLLAGGHDPDGPAPTLAETATAFAEIAAARGTAAKATLMDDLLGRADPITARYLVRILASELRIGLREGHLEAAIAKAFGGEQSAVQWAGMLTGDLGRTAVLARNGALDQAELTLFRPLKSMLASPVADEAAAVARMPPPVWVEDKYDGIRAQLHRLDGEVRLYSRDLHDISGQFPEIVRAGSDLPFGRNPRRRGARLARRTGAAVPHAPGAPRAARIRPSRSRHDVPTIYVAFDLLAHRPAGDSAAPIEPLLREPLRVRRERLDSLGLADRPGIGIANLVTAADEAEPCDDLLGGAAARQRGPDGQGSGLDLHAGPARLRLAQAQAAADDARLRGRRRRGRPRQTPRRPLRLHLRGASTIGPRPRRARWSRSARRTAA